MTVVHGPGTGAAEPGQPDPPRQPSGSERPPAAPRPGTGGLVVIGALAIMGAFLLALAGNLAFVSGLEQRAAQRDGFDTLRAQLAQGTAPVTPTGANGAPLAIGIPVAILNIPAIHLVDTVVFNGTSGAVLMNGPGHQRDTVLPGQAGVSVIMGRAWAYGGPFGHLDALRPGDQLTVTTGQGVARYTVTDLRMAGDIAPAIQAGQGRLTLETALGSTFVPSGVLRVDARLDSAVQPTPALPYSGALPAPERPMGTDPGALLPLLLWVLALTAIGAVAVFSWHRWGRWQTWIVFGPLALTVGLLTADQVTRLLPNLT